MHKVFISYHHENDQPYKEELLRQNKIYNVFIDYSVDTGDIPDHWDDQKIREEIRDEYLKESTVTILLVGEKTKRRKHIDWELYSSMINGSRNKKSGILVINLPAQSNACCHVSHTNERELIYPEVSTWIDVDSRAQFESRHPYVPDRIIDNLVAPEAHVSVLDWGKINNQPDKLRFLIDAAHKDKANCTYDLSRPMRRADS